MPRNPSPMRKESVRTHLKRLAGYNITFDHGTPFPNALAQFVKTLELPREEALLLHAQAVVRGKQQRWRMKAQDAG
jgi:hypothetical protein